MPNSFKRMPRKHFHNVMMNPAFHTAHYQETREAKLEHKVESFFIKIKNFITLKKYLTKS